MSTKEKKKDDSTLISKAIDSLIPDIMKKLFFMGVGGVFLTEEAIRKNLTEFKLPKEVINFIIQQSIKSREEITRIIANEISNVISKINIDKEIKKALSGLTIKVNAEISFSERKESLTTETKFNTSIKKDNQS